LLKLDSLITYLFQPKMPQPRQKRLKTSFVRHLTARFGGITCGQNASASGVGSILYLRVGRRDIQGLRLLGRTLESNNRNRCRIGPIRLYGLVLEVIPDAEEYSEKKLQLLSKSWQSYQFGGLTLKKLLCCLMEQWIYDRHHPIN